MEREIKVLIVVFFFYFAYLIRRELEKHSGIEIIGSCAECGSAVDLACSLEPDIVLMDLHLGSSTMEGIDASREIRVSTDAKVLIFTAHDEKNVMEEASRQAFASGYIMKSQIPLLVENIYELAAGGTGQEKLLLHMALSELTSAEKDVFWKLMGYSSGARMSKKTESNHMTNILKKLRLDNKREIQHVFKVLYNSP